MNSRSQLEHPCDMIVTRFAPSPTGLLHLGHAFSALSAFRAREAGRFLLRIEDLDHTRCRPEYEAAILEDLAWLGLVWEQPVLRQSHHLHRYASALEVLIARDLLYRCFRTRRELAAESVAAPHRPGDVFFGGPATDEEARLAAGQPFAWRLSIERARETLGARWSTLDFVSDGRRVQADPSLLGDVILARKDFPASYHLASVLDDAEQGVTLVVRGEDLRAAAHVHVLLQALFDLPTPTYRHHKLILAPDGKRLAKRDNAATLQSLRASGKSPEDIVKLVGLAD